MKARNFTYALFLLIQFIYSSQLASQITIDFESAPDGINVCGADSLSYFTINVGGSTSLDSVVIRMPAGINYVSGSLTEVNSMGLSLIEANLSNLNRPVFTPVDGQLGGGNFLEFTISKSGLCDAVRFSQAGQLAQDTILIYNGVAQVDTATTSNYNIDYASLTLKYVSVTARDTIVNDLPSEVCRELQITNGGTGYLSTVKHKVLPASGVQNYELSYQGTPLTPVSTNNDTLFYEFDLTDAPFAGTVGDNGSLMYNGDSLIIEECFTINSCEFQNGKIRHQSYWGCDGSICQSSNPRNGNAELRFSQPNLQKEIDFVNNIVCMDGEDRGVIRMRVWNIGQGPAVLNRLSLVANGANTAVIPSSVVITHNGVDISSFFPDAANTVVNASLACGSNVTKYELFNGDITTAFQLLPGEEIFAEMEFIMCCPDDACGRYTRSNPYIELGSTDLCGANPKSTSENARMGGAAYAVDPIITGNSVLRDGDVERFCVEYPEYNFLPVSPGNSYVSFVVGLPEGLVFDDESTTTMEYAGTPLPILPPTVMGDSMIVHILLEDIPKPYNAPLKVCFDVRAVCADGIAGLTSFTLGQSTSINCDPLCMIRLNCSSHDIILFECSGPGDCEEGGGNIISYDVQRVSFGYEDPDDDRDWDSFVRADSANVNIKRALIGDTIRHQSTLGFTAGGNNTAWDKGTYTETYTAGGDQLLCPDTAWVVIRNGMDTYVVGGLTPTAVQNGFEYDLSINNLNSLPGNLPVGYEFSTSDTLYLNTKYAFCIQKAPGWYSNQPGVYTPAKTRDNIIFTGNFKAGAVGDATEYSCGGEAYDEMMFLGAALSVNILPAPLSGSGCDQDFRYLFEVRQNIGGILSGYTGNYDFFPNEFRPLYIPDSIVVKKQPDIDYKNARLVTRQINNASPPGQAELGKDIPLTYEDANILVFKVRDVHDAFGGMLFPYDEENADLRYYIEFQRSCASERRMTTDLSISYTSPLSPGEEFQVTKTGLQTNLNSDLGNITLTQRPQTKPAIDKSTCFDLQVRPNGGKLNYTWLEFVDTTNISILSVSVGGVVLTPDMDGLYRLGEHAGSTTKTITICAELNSCESSDFEVLFGWDCNGYPEDVMYEGACVYDTRIFRMEAALSELQFNMVTQPGLVSGKYPELCSPLLYEMFFNSANDGSVLEPRMEVQLPVGFDIDFIEVEYPRNSGNLENISYTITGNTLSIDLFEHSAMVHDSLPGLETTTNVNRRQVFIRLHGHTGCDFRSGSRLYFTSYGDRACGGPVIGNGRRLASDRLLIDGLQPYEANPEIDIDITEGVTCAVATPVNVSYMVEGGDFIGTDSSLITLSPGINFVDGSLVCTSSDPNFCPEVDRIVPDPNNAGGSLVYLSYPLELSEGNTVNLTFDVIAQDNSSCDEEVYILFENFVTIEDIVCGQTVCEGGVSAITGSDTVRLQINHPDVTFVDFDVVSIDMSANLEYSGSANVFRKGLTADDSLYVKIYCADGSGMPTGMAVDSVLITGPVSEGGSFNFEGYFLKTECALENGLVATIEPVNGCLCSDPAISQPFIEVIERNFGVEMTKSIVSNPEPTGTVNEFTMTYVISVRDTTGNAAYYDLSDTIQYGLGADFVSATVTYGGMDGLQTSILEANPMDTAFQIVENERVRNFGVDSFYVDVVFTVDPEVVTSESADCDYTNDAGGNSGLTNMAVINDGVNVDRDTVCVPIPVPGIRLTKNIESDPVPTGNVNEFTVTYVISVEDTTGVRGYYDLSDTIQLGLGATFVSAEVTYGGADGLQTMILEENPADTAFQIVDDEYVEDFGVDNYYVAVTFTIDPNEITAESADCNYTNDAGGNSGLTNVAVIYDGVPTDRDTACVPIPVPGVEMAKTILSEPVPADGVVNGFTMTYVITVKDTTGVRAFYDLSDTIQYGQGATFVSATVTHGGTDDLNTSIVTPNPVDTAYQIVDDEWVEDFGVDSFYVEVLFTIDPNEITNESADCDYTNDGGSHSGLTNVAVIGDAIPVARDTACAPIPRPGITMTKSVVTQPAPTGNSREFTMSYLIIVEDTTGTRAYYDLTDTVKYGQGAYFQSAVITYTGDGLNTAIVTPNPMVTEYQIMDDEWIEDFGVDSFYVEVTFTIDPDEVTSESADCDYTNDAGEYSGLTNMAVINDGVPAARDSACAPIPDPGLRLTKSIVYGPEPTGNLFEYEMRYDITVQDTIGLPSFYDLSDTLKYASSVTILSISVEYIGDDGLQTSIITPMPTDTTFQIVMDEMLDNLRADVYRVTVIFEVNPNTYSATTAECREGNAGGVNRGLKNVAMMGGSVPDQRDSACADVPPPCLPVNCHAYINLAFGEDCEIEVTADMLIVDNRLALQKPEFYKVELFYGPGIPIPDNILRPEHVGKNITARITFLIDECGGGTCEATIVLEKPNACIIRNTLDTVVYCIDPFLALDPLDPAYPKPDVINVCNSGQLKLELSPDWIMPVSCDEENDTAEVIFREWTATTAGGERCVGVDTIVVFRLPKLTPAAFVGTAEDSFYCQLEAVPNDGGTLKHYAAWKQPVGLHDYELPYTKLGGVTYEIPLTIIEAGLQNAQAQGTDVYNEYLKSVILRKKDGTEVTIGDIVSGDYMNDLIASATNSQKRYGFLQALIEFNEEPVKIILEALVLNYYPYLLLQPGDLVLSEGGNFEQVDEDWFYNGHGNSPYWFSGGWPSIYGNGDCISYCDTRTGDEFGCIRIQVPSLNNETGFDPENCDTICLTAGSVHCGITIERDLIADWTGSCPQTRGVDTKITQTCWAATPNSCADDLTADDVDLVTSYNSTAKKIEIQLSQWQTLIDTVGPIFDFCYPADWDQEEVKTSIRNGVMGSDALEWEQNNPTTYHVGTHDCVAEVYVPSVQVIDNCSGVHSVKAMVDVAGGTRAVAMERTATEIRILAKGDTCYIYTYSHTQDPIRIPFSDCDGALNEVRYEAADNCWNQSTWTKFIQITDDVPPTVVTNRNLNVTLTNKIAWARATSFDEGSWDNCAIDLRLGRRTDWWADSAMVDLCDAAGPHTPYDNWVDLLDDLGVDRGQATTVVGGGTVSLTDFNTKYNVNDLATVLNEGEVENHYFNQIVWLWEDEELCGKKVVHGWLFSIAAYIAENCSAIDEHGNALKVRDLEVLFDRLTSTPGYGSEIAYLGGGWTKDVPFKCEDACEEVPVELLVMDHCCNFGIGKTTVHVDDKSPAKLVKRLPDLDVSCEAYNVFYKDIVENAAALGEQGSVDDGSGVFTALDSVFGRYVKTWVDNQNRPTDIDGNLLPESDLNFDYHSISCGEKTETDQVAVEQHDGTIKWVDKVTQTTYLDTTDLTNTNGIVGINCSATSVQDVWVDLDECGQGTITRRFFISGGCGEVTPQLTLEQVIHVKFACGLRASMFDLPANVGSKDAPVCLPQGLSSSYLPDTIGAATMKLDLATTLCNSVAIGKTIKEYDIDVESSHGLTMKKYVITWSMIDWCADHTSSTRELKYVQEVIATIDPDCNVNGGGDVGEINLISGQVMTELKSAVKDVDMKAVLGQGSPIEIQTSSTGDYSFSIKKGSKVSVVPRKNTGFSEGVSTADLIDIQRHILQKKALGSKYQRIAADVNGNGLIEGLDVLELRRVVLNPSLVFANNTSWRFFDQSTDKEVFDINDLSTDQAVNFTAVKIGDVNLSSDPANTSRSAHGQLQLNIADKALKGGELYYVEVRSDNFEDIRGLQYTMNYADAYVSIESIKPGVLNVTEDNYLKYAPGVITTSWSEADGLSANADDVLFTIVVKAKNAAMLRDVLSLNNRVTSTEAYAGTGDLRDIALNFNGNDSGFALYQNTPNPFKGETVIGFKLPSTTAAVMTIYDVTGRMIKRIEGDFDAGYNEVRVRSIELGTTGVLYYQLDTDKYTATKKMILIN